MLFTHRVKVAIAATGVAISAVAAGVAPGQSAFAATTTSAHRATPQVLCAWGESYADIMDQVTAEHCSDGTVRGIEGQQIWIYPYYGHFEFYGPHGELGNSPDGYWTSTPARITFSPQSAPSGSLWCAKFWSGSPSIGYTEVDNVCVTI
jgi:hypothetical protein